MEINVNTVTRVQAQNWISKSWEIFKKTPFLFIAFIVIEILGSFIFRPIPVIGYLVTIAISALFTTSWFLIVDKTNSGETIEIKDIFLGFKNQYFPVMIYSFFMIFLMVLAIFPMVFAVGFEFIRHAFIEKSFSLPGFTLSLILGMCMTVFIYAVIGMASLYAVPLIVFEKVEMIEAMNLSLRASLSNAWPLAWACFLLLLLCIATSFTLGLAMAVVLPLAKIAHYVSYRELFRISETSPGIDKNEIAPILSS